MKERLSVHQPVIIIINSDKDRLAYLCDTIRNWYSNFSAFTSTDEAIRDIQKEQTPDLIITDLHLEGASVWHLLTTLKSPMLRKTHNVPVLATSFALSDEECASSFENLSVSNFISLPCDKHHLLDIMENLLANSPLPSPPGLLVVDDDSKITSALQKGLSKYGYHVSEAWNTKSAIQKVKNHDIDVILLDHSMPTGNGLDLVRYIREKNMDFLIIAITGEHSAELAQEYSSLGVDWFLSKPFTVEHIAGVIANAQHQRSLRAIERIILKKQQIDFSLAK